LAAWPFWFFYSLIIFTGRDWSQIASWCTLSLPTCRRIMPKMGMIARLFWSRSGNSFGIFFTAFLLLTNCMQGHQRRWRTLVVVWLLAGIPLLRIAAAAVVAAAAAVATAAAVAVCVSMSHNVRWHVHQCTVARWPYEKQEKKVACRVIYIIIE
jgi:hypothetical protein